MSDTFDHAGDAFYDGLDKCHDSDDGFFPQQKPILNEDSHKTVGKFRKNNQSEWEGEGE